jgi:DNA invertase Pin-like site-specific DNA recombinase
MRAAVYARVSTLDQEPENQLRELRLYVEARGWQAVEFIDKGVSGARESRPALDELVKGAKRRKFDTLVVWKLDRFGRNLKHLLFLLDELAALGIGFVSMGEGIDTSTPAGRLQLHILGSIAQFERDRCAERVRLGLARAKAQGKRLGRPRATPLAAHLPSGLTVRDAARQWGVSNSTAARRLRSGAGVAQSPFQPVPLSPRLA